MRSPRPPERPFYAVSILVYASIYVLLLTLALECCVSGGLPSMYAEANLTALVARTLLPRPWREHARWMGAAMIYLLVMGPMARVRSSPRR